MCAVSHFTPAIFKFLTDLEKNNDRDWFKANKARYEDCLLTPALQFISDFGPHLQKVSKHFVADPRPVGGSLFRIYRDTRFSKDKSPYKTHVGIHFRHETGKDAHAPGYYFHIASDECFFAMGLWHPETPIANAIRTAIADDANGWKRAVGNKSFTSAMTLGGEKLARPPRGFDKDHPLVEDLKRKSFMASTKVTRAQVTGKTLPRDLANACKAGAPMMKFLCKALDVPF
jgi:uncharacterized protein (TIGR02453 family)